MSGYGLLLSIVVVCSGAMLYGCYRWQRAQLLSRQAQAIACTTVSARALAPAAYERAVDLQALINDARYTVVARVPVTALLHCTAPAALAAVAHMQVYAVMVDPEGQPCAVIDCQQAQGLAERKQGQYLRYLLSKAGIEYITPSPYASAEVLEMSVNTVLNAHATAMAHA